MYFEKHLLPGDLGKWSEVETCQIETERNQSEAIKCNSVVIHFAELLEFFLNGSLVHLTNWTNAIQASDSNHSK